MNRKAMLSLFIMFVSLVPLRSLGQDSLATLWKITMINGDTYVNVAMDSLQESTLFVSMNRRSFRVSVDSIRELQQEKGSTFWSHAIVGALIGGGAGALIGFAAHKEPENKEFITLDFGPAFSAAAFGAIGAVGGFVVGGLTSVAEDDAGTIRLGRMSVPQARQKIRELLKPPAAIK